jgi:phosphoglycerate dehydrogenase-like enzyme
MLVRGMYRLVREVKTDNWAYRNDYAGQELRQLKLGIIGMGDIGKRVGAIAGAMQMEVSGAGRERTAVQRVLRESDVVSLHVPLTDETRGMIDATALETMRPGAYLINTARGEVVEAAALLRALESGQLAGYASDLLPVGEDDVVRNIVQHPAVIVTPHAASLTKLTYQEMSVITVNNTLEYLKKGKVEKRCIVNRLTI